MKNIFLFLFLCLLLSSCDIVQHKITDMTAAKVTSVHYDQLIAKKNYWDSIPGRVKVRDKNRPYRYYLYEQPYNGKVEDNLNDGKPKLRGTFKDGYATGIWTYYKLNEVMDQTGAFDNGYASGEWRFYDNRGEEDTRLIYHVIGRDVIADTMFVTYNDRTRKEWKADKIVWYYPSGKTKSEISLDGANATYWDENGKKIAVMKDFVKDDEVSGDKIYYLAHGKHIKAHQALLDCNKKWTEEQKLAFETANSVTVTKSGIMGPGSYGFNVKIESTRVRKLN